MCFVRPRLACRRLGVWIPFLGERDGPGAGKNQLKLKEPFFYRLVLEQ